MMHRLQEELARAAIGIDDADRVTPVVTQRCKGGSDDRPTRIVGRGFRPWDRSLARDLGTRGGANAVRASLRVHYHRFHHAARGSARSSRPTGANEMTGTSGALAISTLA